MRYEYIEVLAEGGMSRVWRARDLQSGQEVAVKLPRDEYRDDPSMLERFRRECRAVLELDHPNLVKALSAGEREGLPYLAMEWVEGEDLRARLRREPLSVLQAVDVARQVLAALAYAHSRGLVHRDIAARNVLIDSAGHVKVVDFGIARCVDERTLTKTGQMLGSVCYMAPEQALGEAPGPAVDIYAVGVLLYEMLTGTLPFSSDNPVQLALKHVNEPAPALPDRFGPELQDVVARALEKKPENRFATAEEMQLALARLSLDTTRMLPVVEPEQVDVTLIRPAVVARRGGPRWWHLGAAAVLPLLVTVPLLLRQPGAHSSVPPASATTTALRSVVVKPPASPSPAAEAVTAATPPDAPIRVVELDARPSPAAALVQRVEAKPEPTLVPVAVRRPPAATPKPTAEPAVEEQPETRAMTIEEEEETAPAAVAQPEAPVVEAPAPPPEPIPSLLVLPADKRPEGY